MAFFLLPDKTYNTYLAILTHLRNEQGVTGRKYFHLDFKSAAIKAVRNVFPDTIIVGCDVHFKKCLKEAVKSSCLVPYVNAYPQIQLFCRKLWALSMVPEEDVLMVYTETILPSMPLFEPASDADSDDEELDERTNYTHDQDAYLQYFESTWLGLVNKRTWLRGKPKFKYGLWNKYQSVKEEQADLTSNQAWNSLNKIGLPMKLNVWVVLSAL